MDESKIAENLVTSSRPDMIVVESLNRIAAIQKQRAELAEAAWKQDSKLNIEATQIERSLLSLLRGSDIDPVVLQETLEQSGVNTGDMLDLLVDEMGVVAGKSVYPPTWQHTVSRFAVVPV